MIAVFNLDVGSIHTYCVAEGIMAQFLTDPLVNPPPSMAIHVRESERAGLPVQFMYYMLRQLSQVPFGALPIRSILCAFMQV